MSQIFSCACADSGLQMNTYRICVYIDTLDKAGGYDVHVRYGKGFSGSYLICERNESYVHLRFEFHKFDKVVHSNEPVSFTIEYLTRSGGGSKKRLRFPQPFWFVKGSGVLYGVAVY